MGDHFSKTIFQFFAAPGKRGLERRYLQLKSSWERYAIRTGAVMSEHSLLKTMYLKTERERAELPPTPRRSNSLDLAYDRDGKLMMPVVRVTVAHRGFLIRVQNFLDVFGFWVCQVRINLRGKVDWGFEIEKQPSERAKQFLKMFEALINLLPWNPEPPPGLQESLNQSHSLQKAKLVRIKSDDANFESEYKILASKNLHSAMLSNAFTSSLMRLPFSFWFRGWGNPNSDESYTGNMISLSFLSDTTSDKVESVVELSKLLIDQLIEQELAEPPNVDQVKD